MAANFRIVLSRERGNLHLKLQGDFDGTSALELIRVILENCCSASRVIIHTNDLKEVHPFGKAVFQRQLPFAGKVNSSIVFIGKRAEDLAPQYEDAHQQILMQ